MLATQRVGPNAASAPPAPTPGSTVQPGRGSDDHAGSHDRVLADRVLATLADIEDPELPVGLVDLGLVRRLHVDDGHVTVGLTYTSLACPCVEMIREDVTAEVGALDGVVEVVVEDVLEPWSRDDLTPTGRALLATVAVV